MQERELADDYGWKQVHGDVFRAPPQLGLFAALVGTGWQLTVLALVVLLITIATDLYTEYGRLHQTNKVWRQHAALGLTRQFCYLPCVRLMVPRRSTILTASIFCYALTAMVAGYFSGSIYSQHEGTRSQRARMH